MKSQDFIPVTYLLLSDLLVGRVVRLPLCFLVPRLEREFKGLPTIEETKREGQYCCP